MNYILTVHEYKHQIASNQELFDFSPKNKLYLKAVKTASFVVNFNVHSTPILLHILFHI